MAKLPTPIPIIDTLNTFNRNTESKCPVESLPTFEIDDIDRDYHLSLWFLYVVADNSKATYNSYRREIERLLQWSWRIKGATTHSLDRDDIADYMKFVMRPPKSWIGTVNVPRFTSKDGSQVPNPNWRPFTFTLKKAEKTVSNKYQISQSSIRAVYTTLSSFYEFLIEEKVREDNPVVLDRTKKANIRSQQTKAPVLRITNLQWDYVIETAEVMAEHEPEVHERTLFIMTALYMMYLRVSELVHSDVSRPIMSNFHENEDGWLFHVAGKGKKDRDIALAPDMLKALKRYRKSRGLPPLPSPGEETPLLINHRTAQPLTSTRQVRVIVKQCFDRAHNIRVEEGMENQATELKHATVHWLRHTGISEDVKIRHRDHVRDDAGHSTLATTDRYIDSVLAEKQHSATHKRLKEQ